jgi:hypothetical protein
MNNGIIKIEDYFVKMLNYEGFLKTNTGHAIKKCGMYIGDKIRSHDIIKLEKLWNNKYNEFVIICNEFVDDIKLDENNKYIVMKYDKKLENVEFVNDNIRIISIYKFDGYKTKARPTQQENPRSYNYQECNYENLWNEL